jgi:hypothetical protein
MLDLTSLLDQPVQTLEPVLGIDNLALQSRNSSIHHGCQFRTPAGCTKPTAHLHSRANRKTVRPAVYDDATWMRVEADIIAAGREGRIAGALEAQGR